MAARLMSSQIHTGWRRWRATSVYFDLHGKHGATPKSKSTKCNQKLAVSPYWGMHRSGARGGTKIYIDTLYGSVLIITLKKTAFSTSVCSGFSQARHIVKSGMQMAEESSAIPARQIVQTGTRTVGPSSTLLHDPTNPFIPAILLQCSGPALRMGTRFPTTVRSAQMSRCMKKGSLVW